MWGGTSKNYSSIMDIVNFNPPTPCGVGLVVAIAVGMSSYISIHPPRVGWDGSFDYDKAVLMAFQSTHPVWGGTSNFAKMLIRITFQSTHPVWGGTETDARPHKPGAFQSTHPVWGGTTSARMGRYTIHDFNPPTPCGVGQRFSSNWRKMTHFNPPTPCGVGQQ